MSRIQKTPWLGKEPNQKVWYIYWFETARRVRRRSTRTYDRSEAEKLLAEFIIENADKEKHGPIEKPEKYTIATALYWYLQEHAPEISTTSHAARAAENLIEFFGSDTTVSCLTPQTLKRYQRERKRKDQVFHTKTGTKTVKDDRPIAPATVRRELVVLVAALNHAVVNGRLTSAPKILLPPMGQNKTRYLEQEEIERLLNNSPAPHVRLFIRLGISTGARKGALLDLKWEQIDFKNKLIYLNPPGRKQTKKKRAIVPLNDQLYDDLVKTKNKQEEYVQEMAKNEGVIIAPCEYVVAYKFKKIKNIRKAFNRSCERAGIKGVTPHTLRHTAGTLMALGGVDLFLIARLLGHSVQKTTELYAHLTPDYLRGAANILENAAYHNQPSHIHLEEQTANIVH